MMLPASQRASHAADLAHEALEHARALQGVRYLRMELDRVVAARFIGHRSQRCVGRGSYRCETRRNLFDPITVAHPDVEHRAALGVAVIGQLIEQPARRGDGHLRVAELTVIGAGDAAAELLRHGLHAVADAQHRDAGFKHGLRRLRWLRIRHGLRPARQDDAARAEGANVGVAHVPGMDLAVDAAFADTARDQLRVLGPEIEDQDAVCVDIGRAHRRSLLN